MALTSCWPERNIIFRNIGWTGDIPEGRARVFFDPVEKGRYSFHAEKGLATITLAVREDLPKKSELSIKIMEVEGSTVQVQIVNGK